MKTENGSASKAVGLGQLGELIAVVSRLLTKIVSAFDSEMIQKILENPKGLEAALRKMLIDLTKKVSPTFSVWKTISLGTGLKTADDFRRVLKVSGYKVEDWANDILDKSAFKVSETKTTVELVRVSSKELGFEDEVVYYRDICARAKKLGLKLCPAEVGPQLRLQDNNQSLSKWWTAVAMEPIRDSREGLRLFVVTRHGDDLWLRTHISGSGYPWHVIHWFVFCK